MKSEKTTQQLVDALRAQGSEANRKGMARFGVAVDSALGVSMPNIRAIGKTTVKDHQLALALWETGIHEARILAALVDIPSEVSRQQMNEWASDFNSWDLCDQVTGNLFDRLPFADAAIDDWRNDPREFVKRAAFAMIAWRAVHLKKEPDSRFLKYLPMIAEAADDERNFVRKAVNWALRQIGKRSSSLHESALDLAQELAQRDSKAARWIAKDAIRELDDVKVRSRLGLPPSDQDLPVSR